MTYQLYLNETITKTNERMIVTTDGWDGTGYEGEGKERIVYANAKGEKFVKGRFGNIWSYLKITDRLHKVSGLPITAYYCDCKAR